MLPGQEEGAADFLVQTLAPSHFPFSVSSFRPGNLNLFGALLQPHAPEKNASKRVEKFLQKKNAETYRNFSFSVEI